MKSTNIMRILRSPRVFASMVSAFAISFGLYSFAIASTTVNAADSNVLNGDIQELRTEIAELEGSYYAMMSTIDEAYALQEGYSLAENVSFAQVDQTTLVAYRN